jgi:hypothetical protein
MRKNADATCGKSIAVRSQSILDISAVGLLAAFYDILGRKGGVLFYSCVPDTTRD